MKTFFKNYLIPIVLIVIASIFFFFANYMTNLVLGIILSAPIVYGIAVIIINGFKKINEEDPKDQSLITWKQCITALIALSITFFAALPRWNIPSLFYYLFSLLLLITITASIINLILLKTKPHSSSADSSMIVPGLLGIIFSLYSIVFVVFLFKP